MVRALSLTLHCLSSLSQCMCCLSDCSVHQCCCGKSLPVTLHCLSSPPQCSSVCHTVVFISVALISPSLSHCSVHRHHHRAALSVTLRCLSSLPQCMLCHTARCIVVGAVWDLSVKVKIHTGIRFSSGQQTKPPLTRRTDKTCNTLLLERLSIGARQRWLIAEAP